MTALTAYMTSTASSTLSTANQLYSVLGTPTTTQKTSLLGTATGWGEIYSQGNAGAWAAAGAIGSPSGHGFLWDVTTLELQTLAGGTFTSAIRFQLQGAGAVSLTADLHCRAYKYNGSSYTQIVDTLLAAQTLSTAATTFSLSGTGTSTAFSVGEKLYVDIWCNVTASSNPSGVTIQLRSLSTDTVGQTGNNTAQVVTPGYSPTPLSRYSAMHLMGVG